jgi:PDZ domain-containing secreted protein
MKIVQKEYNAITGKETITERDETAAEIEQREKFEAEQAAEAAEQATLEAAKEPVKAKLEALGLTAEDLKALGL